MGQGVVPQDSGLQAPPTQTVPIAQEMPTHGRSVHVVIPTQTCIALHVAFGQVGGKHEPFTQTLEPWHVTPAHVTSTQTAFLHTKPAPHVVAPQSRVTQRPSVHVSFAPHVTPTHAFC